MPQINHWLLASALLLLIAGCAIESEAPSTIPPIHQVESLNTIGASSDPVKVQMGIQEATEVCKQQGKRVVIVDTRTAAYPEVGTFSYGDIKYVCVPE